MDSTLTLLKEEINKTLESEHDLAKWKLAVTAALGVTAFGLTKESVANPWLLLFVPFVCAYIDLYAYQYQSRIAVLAGFLRDHPGGDGFLQQYEERCDTLRGKGFFSLGVRAGFGCSLGATILGPAFYLVLSWHSIVANHQLLSHAMGGIIWLIGLALIVYLWKYAKDQAKELAQESFPTTPASAVV